MSDEYLLIRVKSKSQGNVVVIACPLWSKPAEVVLIATLEANKPALFALFNKYLFSVTMTPVVFVALFLVR